MTSSTEFNSSCTIQVIHIANKHKEDQVNSYLEKFDLPNDTCKKIINDFTNNLSTQLTSNNSSKNTSVKPVITPIKKLNFTDPKPGKNCVFLDFGGKFFRVGLGTFAIDASKCLKKPLLHTEVQILPVPKRLYTSSVEEILNFVTQRVKVFTGSRAFLDHINLGHGETIEIAFVFSFPFDYINNDMAQCKIRRFTKQVEFTSDDRDIAAMLEQKLNGLNLENNINFKVNCVLNDTTATLLSFANTNIYDVATVDTTNCMISLIFGTGLNIAYYDTILERLVCAEVGGYGEMGELDFIKTEIDTIVNQTSCHPGQQSFEKFGISDPYMGEAVRLILQELIRKEVLFIESSIDLAYDDEEPSPLDEEKSLLGSEFVSKILKNRDNIVQVQDLLAKYNLYGTFSDSQSVINICLAITKRATKLVAAMLCAIICRISTKFSPSDEGTSIVVACDGNLWRKHPMIQQDVHRYVHEFLRMNGNLTNVRFANSVLSSGPGAVACSFGRLWEA